MRGYIVCTLVKDGFEDSLVIIERPDSSNASYEDLKITRLRARLLNSEAGFNLYHVRELYKDGVISQPL